MMESGGLGARSSMLNWKLVAFTDSGSVTFPKNHSISPQVVLFGDVLVRGGAIQRHVLLIDRRCAEIHRVCRSALSAEAHAVVTAVEVELRTQILLAALFSGKYDYARLNHLAEFPIVGPLNQDPANQESKQETKYEKAIALSKMIHSDNPLFAQPSVTIVMFLPD